MSESKPRKKLAIGFSAFGACREPCVSRRFQFQTWINKFGDKITDKSAFQALAVWRF